MPKRTTSKIELGLVEKKTKNNNVNNNKSSCFELPQKTEHCEFIRLCISNSLKEDDKKALEKLNNFTFKGDQLI